MRRLTAITLAATFLAACGTTATHPTYPGYPGYPSAPATPGTFLGPAAGPEVTYLCEDLTTIVVRPRERTAVATLNSGLEMRLAQQPYSAGNRYGDANYDFRSHGNAGIWVVAQRTPRACRLKP